MAARSHSASPSPRWARPFLRHVDKRTARVPPAAAVAERQPATTFFKRNRSCQPCDPRTNDESASKHAPYRSTFRVSTQRMGFKPCLEGSNPVVRPIFRAASR